MTSGSQPRPDGWADHERIQLKANLATTPQERLKWLEQAIRFAHASGALPRRDPPRVR